MLRALVDKGFIVEDERTLPGYPPVTIKVYGMPIHVHIRWAAQCFREAEAEEREKAKREA